MTPAELRQAVPGEVERHMRDKGVWPEGLRYSDHARFHLDERLWCLGRGMRPTEIPEWAALNLIGWAIEGAIGSFERHEKNGMFTVSQPGDDPEWAYAANHPITILVAAYRRVCMSDAVNQEGKA